MSVKHKHKYICEKIIDEEDLKIFDEEGSNIFDEYNCVCEQCGHTKIMNEDTVINKKYKIIDGKKKNLSRK